VLRTATRDVEIRGRKIREGERVVAWLASANRDEDAFSNSDVFDVARTPNEHCGFLYGEHFCIGAHLARLQLRVMLEELLERMPDLELAGKVERLAAVQIGGIKHMPVRFTPVRPQ
jgi:cytochrome P450